MILLSPLALRDRSAIYAYTAEQWSQEQADNYADFLDAAIAGLARNPSNAPFLPNLTGVRSYTVRWKNAQQGHRIIFEEIADGIHVLRILHTAMNWPDHL